MSEHIKNHSLPEVENNVLLDIENLCMYFGGVRAVDGLSFHVNEGEIFGLIGPNGAGKTTVFNCITQFYKPTSGEIWFRNREGQMISLNKEKVHDMIKIGIVRTFQNVEVIRELTVEENLLIAGHTMYKTSFFGHALHRPLLKKEETAIKEKVNQVLDFMELTPYKNRYAIGLPYGILKKIEIARTLMCEPKLVILDEPAAGLNDTETADLAKLIRRIREEYHVSILLVEHDMGLVMDVCDRICAISFGKMLAMGTPQEIQEDESVRTAYLGHKKAKEA